MPTGQRTGIS